MGYLTRQLGLRDYGRYALTILLSSWIGIAIGAMSGGATIRLVAGSLNGRRYAVTTIQLVTIYAVTAGALLGLGADRLAHWVEEPQIAPILRIMALNVPVAALTGIYTALLTAQGRSGMLAFYAATGLPVQLAMVLLLVGRGWGIYGAAYAILISSSVQLVLGFGLTGISPFTSQRVSFRQLWSETRLQAGTQFVIRIIEGIDLILVKIFLTSPSIAGLYAGAQNIGLASVMLFNPSSGIVIQSLSKSILHERPQERNHTATAYLRVALIYGGLLVAFSGLADRIVLFLLGEGFQSSSEVVMILLWAGAFRIASVAGRTLVFSAGKKLSALPSLLSLLVAGILAYAIVLPRYGATGGAMVTAAVSLVLAVMTLRDGTILTGINFPWLTLLRVLIATAATTLLALYLRNFGISVLWLLTFTAAAYAAILIIFREWTPKRGNFKIFLTACRS